MKKTKIKTKKKFMWVIFEYKGLCLSRSCIHPHIEQILSLYNVEDIILSSANKTGDPGSCLALSLVEDKDK